MQFDCIRMVNLKNKKNYKEISSRILMKRGQVGVFVIVAIVIVVGGILVYLFIPQIRTIFQGEMTPNAFLKNCVEQDVRNNIELLASQGGYINPEGTILYKGKNVKYLCYTSEYFVTCNIQQPLIKNQFERELEIMTKQKASACVEELITEYKSRGYSVEGVRDVSSNVKIVPNNIRITVEAPLTVRKKDSAQSYRTFNIDLNSEMYSLLMISASLIKFESIYGNTQTDLYYLYYPNLLIYKEMKSDGTTIYTVKDATTSETFTFASRSLAWDGGYGID